MSQVPNNVTYVIPQASYADPNIYNSSYQPNSYLQPPPPTTAFSYQIPIPIDNKEQYIQPATYVQASPISVGQVVYPSPSQNQPPAQLQYQQPQQFTQNQQFNQLVPTKVQQYPSEQPQDQPIIYTPLQKVDTYRGEFATNRIVIINNLCFRKLCKRSTRRFCQKSNK